MELALSLGHHEATKPFKFIEKCQKIPGNKELGFCMGAVGKLNSDQNKCRNKETGSSSSDPPVQLDLLPFSPVHKNQPSSNKFPFPWLNEKLSGYSGKGLDEAPKKEGSHDNSSSPLNSTTIAVSSFQMDFSIFRKRDFEGNNIIINEDIAAGTNSNSNSRGCDHDDDDENGTRRKKLRLTKDQSAFLEDSFKEHNTLNPKQKLALAKQLNLRPRQVEVWFQNRRARTKLKQTEVDCEYLKRCCETLTEENKRLQKELQELRSIKALNSHQFYMQLPATTLTMCPSCEKVAATTVAAGKKPTQVLSLSPN